MWNCVQNIAFLGLTLLSLTQAQVPTILEEKILTSSSITAEDSKKLQNDSISITQIDDHSELQELEFEDQCYRCLGSSACVINSNGDAECVCPPDFTGPQCSETRLSMNGSCDPNPCHNGGTCVPRSDVFICVCSRHYAGLQCTRQSRIFTVSLDIYIGTRYLAWNDANKIMGLKTQLCRSIEYYLKRGSHPEIGALFDYCNVEPFSITEFVIEETPDQTVHTILELKFDSGNEKDQVQLDPVSIKNQLISGYIAAPPGDDDVGINPTKDKSFEIAALDYCGKQTNNDCSHYATCSPASKGGYQCACPHFYSDGSAEIDMKPGRFCEYGFKSGLAVGCLVMLPILILLCILFFCYRRYQANRIWIGVQQKESDTLNLVETTYPKYNL